MFLKDEDRLLSSLKAAFLKNLVSQTTKFFLENIWERGAKIHVVNKDGKKFIRPEWN